MTSHQSKIELNAELRTITGRKVKQVRESGLIPAVLYGKGQEPISLQVPSKDFRKALKSAGESTLVYLSVDGQAYPTIIHDIARHPASDEVIHADFYKVNLSQKIKTMVPVAFIGESQAVKDGGILIRNMNEVEVEALPQDLPHEISFDISSLLAFGDQILIKDAKVDKKVSLLGNAEDIVAAVQAPISEEALAASLESGTETVDDVKIVEKEKKDDEILDEAEAPAAAPTE
ncbi:MAG: 50S ribosomal protein L25 [Candidatus Pacebacteria bacterium]|nr:50S ribosomal protein L25 [Candidatus Paceibacterota bacterium]